MSDTDSTDIDDNARVYGPVIGYSSGSVTTTYNITHIYRHIPPRPVDEATLAAAQQRLAAIPLDTIPDVAPLPEGSRMPHSRNPLFVGRASELTALAQALKEGGSTVATPVAAIGQIAAATGLGGIGKTQLATEFVHRYGQYFAGGVFWLSFAEPAAVPGEVAACGGLGLIERPDFTELKLDDQVRLVLAAWQSALPRLLIFDNCEDQALLAAWRPPTGGGRVLVTSRRAHWDPTLGIAALPLDVLPRPESIALLRKFRSALPADDSGLNAIAAELDDLPLALHLAGSYLARYQHAITPAAYLEQLRNPALLQHRSMQGGALSPTGHVQDVGRTFALSYERLDIADPTDGLAIKLLARTACLAPGVPIPRELLVATLELPSNDSDAVLQAQDAVERLIDLGLLEDEAGETLRLHRLLVVFIRNEVTDAEAQSAVEQALVNAADSLNAAKYATPLFAVQPHLRIATDSAMKREDERAADLCGSLGYLLWRIGDYDGARHYYERSLAIRATVLGENHPDTATILEYLGDLLDDQGDYNEARHYYERSLAIREAVLGEHHPDTATSLDNLGLLLHNLGDYTGARRYYERALAIRETLLGDNHPDLAISLNNLGVLFDDQGDYTVARRYYERALAIDEATYGPTHPELATDLNNLGKLLRAGGDYEGARPYIERALAIHEVEFGKDHPDTAWNLNSLGELLYDQGDYAGAQRYYERALALREAALETDHPDIAWSLTCLGDVLREQGDYTSARSSLERALTIYETRWGETHPDTAATLNSLGVLSIAQEDYATAQSYLERALAVRKATLDKNHPDIARTLNSLGLLFYAQGNNIKARRYIKRALKICEVRLGPHHPTTYAIQANLTTHNTTRKAQPGKSRDRGFGGDNTPS